MSQASVKTSESTTTTECMPVSDSKGLKENTEEQRSPMPVIQGVTKDTNISIESTSLHVRESSSADNNGNAENGSPNQGRTSKSFHNSSSEVFRPANHGQYRCPVCKHRFNTSKSLRQHMGESHANQKKLPCEVCGKVFYRRGALKIHEQSHTSTKKHKCNVCDNTYATGSALRIHKLSHNGETPLQCKLCDYRCVDRTYLRIHMISHSQNTPYSCHICKKNFNRSGSLQIHMRIHSNEKPYLCDVCNKGFTHYAGLYLHKNSKSECTAGIIDT